jgi:hypothetical protein
VQHDDLGRVKPFRLLALAHLAVHLVEASPIDSLEGDDACKSHP